MHIISKQKSSLYFTSHMKISESKSNDKTPKNPFSFDSIKNSFWLHILNGIQKLLPQFKKKVIESFLRKVHFTSPPIWKFLSPRVTTKPPKIHLILIQ